MSLQEDLDATMEKVADYLHNVCGVQDFTVNKNGSINVHGNVIMFNSQETELALKLSRVTGNFICCYSKLKSMKNFPEHVLGRLDISFTNICSLNDLPDTPKMQVHGDFVCTKCGFNEKDIRSAAKVNGKVYCE